MRTLIFILALTALGPAQTQAIVGGTLVNSDGSEPLRDAVILIEGERIVGVGSRETLELPAGATVVDAKGKWIIPGLVDAHVHFFLSAGLYARPDILDLRKLVSAEEEGRRIKESLPDTFARYLRCGITSVADMGGPMWNYKMRELARQSPLAPRVAVAGPLVSTYAPPELMTEDPSIILVKEEEKAREIVRQQVKQQTDLVKIWFILGSGRNPNQHMALVKATIDESHKHGVRVAVHATQLETARVAVSAGADILAHSVGDKPVDEDFVKLLLARGTIYITTLVVREGYGEVFNQQLELMDIEHEVGSPRIISSLFDLRHIAAEHLPEGLRKRIQNPRPLQINKVALQNLKTLQDAGVLIAAGTDAGNIGTLHGPSLFRELALMRLAGLSPSQILSAATRGGARVMGAKDLGTIAKGMLADLVILDADPLADILNTRRIHRVIKGGSVLRPSQILPKRPEDIVQQQVNAYNARDIEVYVSTFAKDAVISTISASGVREQASGHAGIREAYAGLFKAALGLHCEIKERLVEDNTVVDQGVVTGIPDRGTMRGIVIYQVRDGLIQRVWFCRDD